MSASGIYEVQLQPKEGPPERRAYAFNVPVGEGDLHIVSREDLTQQFAGVDFDCTMPPTWRSTSSSWPACSWATPCWERSSSLLLVEQVLAYVASFHPPALQGVRR